MLRARAPRILVAVLASAYTAVLLVATLRPLPFATEGDQATLGILDPAAWLDVSSWLAGRPLEVLVNIALFVPIGAAAVLLLRGAAVVVAPLALTLGIELLQIPLDRISHPRDLVANAVGALVGIAIAALAVRRAAGGVDRRVLDRPAAGR